MSSISAPTISGARNRREARANIRGTGINNDLTVELLDVKKTLWFCNLRVVMQSPASDQCLES